MRVKTIAAILSVVGLGLLSWAGAQFADLPKRVSVVETRVEFSGESVDGSFVVQDSFLSILGVSDEIKATIVRDMATAQGSVEV